jgi:hypothetical protein
MISDAVKLSTVERLIATRRPFPRALRERFERDTREGSGPSSNRRSSFTIFYSRRTCFRPGRMAGLSGDSRGDRDAAHGRRRSRHSAAQIAHGPQDRCRDPAARDEPAGSVRFRRERQSVQRSLSISAPAQHVAPRREPASESLDRPGRFLVCLRPAFRRRAVPLRYALAGSEHRFAGASRRRLHHDDGSLSA